MFGEGGGYTENFRHTPVTVASAEEALQDRCGEIGQELARRDFERHGQAEDRREAGDGRAAFEVGDEAGGEVSGVGEPLLADATLLAKAPQPFTEDFRFLNRHIDMKLRS